jgi:hypothetical protein
MVKNMVGIDAQRALPRHLRWVLFGVLPERLLDSEDYDRKYIAQVPYLAVGKSAKVIRHGVTNLFPRFLEKYATALRIDEPPCAPGHNSQVSNPPSFFPILYPGINLVFCFSIDNAAISLLILPSL